MKRDMELVKKILKRIEEHETNELIYEIALEDYDSQKIYYHCHLLIEANLIEGEVDRALGGRMRINRIYGLSWDGHEFLDAAKNEKVWNSVKDKIKEQSISIPFSIMKNLLLDKLSDLL